MNQQEQSAIAAFWVLDGIDHCCIGYLPKAYVKNWKQMKLSLRLLKFIQETVTVPQSARIFIETMVLLWQQSSLPQNHANQLQRSIKTTQSLNLPSGKGVANETVGLKEVNETPD